MFLLSAKIQGPAEFDIEAYPSIVVYRYFGQEFECGSHVTTRGGGSLDVAVMRKIVTQLHDIAEE